MTLHLGLAHVHQRNAEQQQEVRDARKWLKEHIRDDWDYPALPSYQAIDSGRHQRGSRAKAEENRVAGFRFHTPSEHESRDVPAGLAFEPTEWQEREYSSASDSEEGGSPVAVSSRNGNVKNKKSDFRFEAPDSVGTEIAERRQARKRKRQKELAEELEWNAGLTHWARRRDIWCAAHTEAQIHGLENRAEGSGGEDVSTSASASVSTTPRSSTSSTAETGWPSATASSSPATTPDQAPAPTILALRPTVSPSPEIRIPIAPAILSNHSVRRRISPAMYSEIYNKIILQSRVPSVPINLRPLISALVKGWKDDGEWPPKATIPEPSVGRRKTGTSGSQVHRGFKDGVKAVGRALRLTGTSETNQGNERK